jgi:hypothetical protein
MLECYKKRNEKVARLLDSVGKNCTMTSPEIQKYFCKACGEQTIKAIVKDIGVRYFSVLVDEAWDVSVKEQMVVILRYFSY